MDRRSGRSLTLYVGFAALLMVSLTACGNSPQAMPIFERTWTPSDALPSELQDSIQTMQLDEGSSRLLGADSRGYQYFVVKSYLHPSETEQCLAAFIGSGSSVVLCSPNLPLVVSAYGLGTATLNSLPRRSSNSEPGEWVSDYLHVEPELQPSGS